MNQHINQKKRRIYSTTSGFGVFYLFGFDGHVYSGTRGMLLRLEGNMQDLNWKWFPDLHF